MTRLTPAEYRELQQAERWAAKGAQRIVPTVTPAQAARLRSNAADPAKARKRKRTLADATREREHVQPAIEDYLRAEGLFPIPINSGAATIIGGRACLKGVPDLVTWIPACRKFVDPQLAMRSVVAFRAILLFIECKRPKGGQYSAEQLAFRDRAIADGCLWIGATCVEDVAAVIPPRRTPPPAAAAREAEAVR